MAKKLLCLCMTLLVMLGVTACSSSQKTADLPKVMEDMKAIMENKAMMHRCFLMIGEAAVNALVEGLHIERKICFHVFLLYLPSKANIERTCELCAQEKKE